MKVVVLSASRHRNCTLKDVAGGYGTVFTVGNSWFARLLEIAKRRIASIPSVTAAYLQSIMEAQGAEVVIKHNELEPADLYLIASSITDCNYEKELGIRPANSSVPRSVILEPLLQQCQSSTRMPADFIVKSEIEDDRRGSGEGEDPLGSGGCRLCS